MIRSSLLCLRALTHSHQSEVLSRIKTTTYFNLPGSHTNISKTQMIEDWAAKDNLHVVGYVGLSLYLTFFTATLCRTVAVMPRVNIKHPKFAFHCALTASFFFELWYFLGFAVEGRYLSHLSCPVCIVITIHFAVYITIVPLIYSFHWSIMCMYM